MRGRSIKLRLIFALAGVVLAGGLVVLFWSRRPEFDIGVRPDDFLSGTNATGFAATITNASSFAVKIDTVQFEWRDQLGQVVQCERSSRWRQTIRPGSALIVRGLIPDEAQSFRVRVVCYDTATTQNKIADWLKNRKVDRWPWLARSLTKIGLMEHRERHGTYPGLWFVHVPPTRAKSEINEAQKLRDFLVPELPSPAPQ